MAVGGTRVRRGPGGALASSAVSRPRVVLLRGHNANVWDVRPWERLADAYDVELLVTGSNLHEVGSAGVRTVEARTPRDSLPGGRAAGAAAYALGERYLGLEEQLAGADDRARGGDRDVVQRAGRAAEGRSSASGSW